MGRERNRIAEGIARIGSHWVGLPYDDALQASIDPKTRNPRSGDYVKSLSTLALAHSPDVHGFGEAVHRVNEAILSRLEHPARGRRNDERDVIQNADLKKATADKKSGVLIAPLESFRLRRCSVYIGRHRLLYSSIGVANATGAGAPPLTLPNSARPLEDTPARRDDSPGGSDSKGSIQRPSASRDDSPDGSDSNNSSRRPSLGDATASRASHAPREPSASQTAGEDAKADDDNDDKDECKDECSCDKSLVKPRAVRKLNMYRPTSDWKITVTFIYRFMSTSFYSTDHTGLCRRHLVLLGQAVHLRIRIPSSELLHHLVRIYSDLPRLGNLLTDRETAWWFLKDRRPARPADGIRPYRFENRGRSRPKFTPEQTFSQLAASLFGGDRGAGNATYEEFHARGTINYALFGWWKIYK
ncbi:hypothetical protein UCRNP2_5166 [Neofusicoccum parvum UCRNP2]|uniref:Uncharacterized protein n=1 Tax=Botryosphaeria parva (strain UCR-NP2) TaxID=1287680 RepID=R1G982_BOTPV|nr:hypothetical protein UCRNP2_5166 [Neofusicoccum parvum UCRNP2]